MVIVKFDWAIAVRSESLGMKPEAELGLQEMRGRKPNRGKVTPQGEL